MTLQPRRRLVSRSWQHLPRRTARLRLTLLYGALFLCSGVVLLAITYLLFERAVDQARGPVPTSKSNLTSPTINTIQQTLDAAARTAAAAQNTTNKHDLLINSAIALAIVAALALLLGWLLAGRVLTPIRTITTTAQRISASNLHERLALHDADDEFKQLGDTLDDLFSRLSAAFDAQRHFVANASHELRTPLTVEQALLEAVLTDPDPDPSAWRNACERALTASRQQGHIIDSLLDLARSEGGLDHVQEVDLAELCDHVLQRLDFDMGTLALHVETTIRHARLDGDPRLIDRLVTNLVDNAIVHNVAHGQIQISTAAVDERATLSVSNSGPLIPPDALDRLFQPFQRLDPQRTHHKNGHGLGLSIVRAIATAHHAAITARSLPEGGLSVEVVFPPPALSVPPNS